MTTSGRIGAFMTAGRGTAALSVAISFSRLCTVVVGMAAAVAIAGVGGGGAARVFR